MSPFGLKTVRVPLGYAAPTCVVARQITEGTPHAAEEHWRQLAHRSGYNPATAAKLLGFSLRHLERLARRDLNCPPSEWFHRARLDRGTELLAEGKTVKAVATQLGYTHPGNFSRDFKRRFGRTPRACTPNPLLNPLISQPAPENVAR